MQEFSRVSAAAAGAEFGEITRMTTTTTSGFDIDVTA